MSELKKINDSAYFVTDDSTKYIVDSSTNSTELINHAQNNKREINDHEQDNPFTRDDFMKALKTVSTID